MESIKTITIKDKTYQIQASVDDKGRVISETYLTKDGDKVLSEQNFTTELKNKLDGIEAQANKYEHPANHPAFHLFMTEKRCIILFQTQHNGTQFLLLANFRFNHTRSII